MLLLYILLKEKGKDDDIESIGRNIRTVIICEKEGAMNIRCLADDYAVKEKNSIYYVYNVLYEEELKKVLFALLIGLFIPEASDYYIPICIQIKKPQGAILIRENLEVIGSAEIEYFIIKHQYKKWKKAYAIVRSIIYTLCVLLVLGFISLFLKTNYHFVMGICVVAVIFLALGAILKLELNNKKRKKYEVRDMQ